mmetsp:Transcript_6653/g.10994  ORF Transcript_6653/g.10994 Transcript_6653/m.10994 type:complete len:251 (-) Transcript_6653:1196-1948(-)
MKTTGGRPTTQPTTIFSKQQNIKDGGWCVGFAAAQQRRDGSGRAEDGYLKLVRRWCDTEEHSGRSSALPKSTTRTSPQSLASSSASGCAGSSTHSSTPPVSSHARANWNSTSSSSRPPRPASRSVALPGAASIVRTVLKGSSRSVAPRPPPPTKQGRVSWGSSYKRSTLNTTQPTGGSSPGATACACGRPAASPASNGFLPLNPTRQASSPSGVTSQRFAWYWPSAEAGATTSGYELPSTLPEGTTSALP